jgi:hypothetical protein
MNPFLIPVLAVLIVLLIVGSYVGRKQQEWKNLLRITLGVGAFVGGFRLILASNWDQWTKVGVFVCIVAALFGLSVVKNMSRNSTR